MTPEQSAALAELVHQLQGAFVIKARPPSASLVEPTKLSDLIDRASASLPEKYRPVVLKLERQIRAELNRELQTALDVSDQVGASLPGDHLSAQLARWAYQAGLVVGAIMHFTAQPPVKAPPSPPGGRTPRENR